MGNSSSDLLEELLFMCHQLEIIDPVRVEVKKTLEKNPSISLLEAYENAFEKVRKTKVHQKNKKEK